MSAERPVEFLRPAGLYRDAEYAYVAVAPPGRLVFSAGACPVGVDGVVVGAGDLEAQARKTVSNLFEALAAAGAGAGDILKTTVFVVTSSHDELVAVWAVVKAAFEPFDPPSTLLGVSVLGYTNQLVEIEAVALVPAPSDAASSPE
jgi:enamine deaminase RidA (YjgF/YER057c/UK114 family)